MSFAFLLAHCFVPLKVKKAQANRLEEDKSVGENFTRERVERRRRIPGIDNLIK